ncbi:MAG TPA: NrfD/PsrC family molybdoenzyme membrane anchor subunit [Chloroflexota bacterium]|nr:NrfD/PsrC family molybdoenzyme membrane anchor subunit [Chloroflexota bacterium]
MPRETLVHWTWLVYLEMFCAGTAAGAYVTAAILELLGRGRSPIVRTAHLIAFPLMALAGLLLIVDLQHPERFWHMLLQSERLVPMLKWWSPMSLGSWGVLLFNLFAFVSFLDALVATDQLHVFGWRSHRTLHGSPLGLVWSILGGVAAFFVAGYSGVLLNVTNMPGWSDSTLIGGLFVAISAATGMAAVLFVHVARDRTGPEEVELERANTLAVVWQLVFLVLFLVTAPAGLFLTGLPLLAIVLAVILVLVALLFRTIFRTRNAPASAFAALLVLLGGFLLRYAVVMGPQQHG